MLSGKGPLREEDTLTGGPTNFEGMSQVKFDRQSMDASQYAERTQEVALKQKQTEVLQNPNLKSSLTTNIRNIMRN